MNRLIKAYNELIDNDISITDLYVYNALVQDERTYLLTEEEIMSMIRKFWDISASIADYGGDINEIIEHIIEGDDDRWA